MTTITTDQRAAAHGSFGLLLTASLVSSLIMLDSNIVAVSLPAIGRSLGASFTDIQWVISAYVLTYAALLLAAGNYADLFGRRQAMVIGLAIFAVSSGLCGLATSPLILNLARAVQGVGGALLLTASLAIISNAFAGAERTRAFAFWGAALGIALAVGPILGGVITNLVGWRWVFLVNIPASAVLIIATLRTIDESKDPHAEKLDLPGIVTFSVGLALAIWALIDGNDRGWTSAGVLGRLAVAALLLATFVAIELRQRRPMVDFLLFRRSTFLGAVLAMIGYGLSAQVMVFLLPLALQNAYDLDPLWAGVAMIPFAVPMVVAPRVTTALAARFSGRSLLAVGLLISCVGNILFWLVARAHLPYPVFALGMLVAGCGAGLLNGQTVKVLQGAVPPERAGMASGIASTTRFIGILVSVAVLGAILSSEARSSVLAAAPGLGLEPAAAEVAAKLITAGDLSGLVANAPAAIQGKLHAAGLDAYGIGFAAASALAAVLAILSAVLAFVFVKQEDTAPTGKPAPGVKRPCKYVDCRDPL